MLKYSDQSKSEFVFTKDTPYLTLTGELLSVKLYAFFEKIDHVIKTLHCLLQVWEMTQEKFLKRIGYCWLHSFWGHLKF